MSRYSANTTKTCRSESNTRIARECNCYDSLKKFRHNLQTLEPHSRKCNTGNTKPCTKKPPASTGTNVKNVNSDRQRDRSPPRPAADQKKTWFQVLVNSPKKAKPEKLLHTARNKVDIPCKYAAALTTDVENVKENVYPNNKEMKRVHLLVDMIHDKINGPSDRQFLKLVADINNMLQTANENRHFGNMLAEHGTLEHSNSYSHFKNGDFKTGTDFKCDPITDDDKHKFKKPESSKPKVSEKSDELSDITLRALVKLLENSKSVSAKAEDQRALLHNLTQLVGQFREENKMVNKLKDIRIDLESKLASFSMENQYLKQQLQSSERERDRTNRLLEMKEKEIESLRKYITSIKGTIAGKINNGFDEAKDHSVELQHLNETIASLPSHDQSFEMLIRPASSSPTNNVLRSNNPERLHSCATNGPNDRQPLLDGLLKLRENIKKTVEDLQADPMSNDISLNLSDVTYKWSS